MRVRNKSGKGIRQSV